MWLYQKVEDPRKNVGITQQNKYIIKYYISFYSITLKYSYASSYRC